MTVPNMSLDAFVDYLKNNGCEVVSDENWHEYNRVMLSNGDVSFPLQCQTSGLYYHVICKICDDLGVEPPEECKKVRDQIRTQFKK